MLNDGEAGRRFEDFRVRCHRTGIELRARDRRLACQLRHHRRSAGNVGRAGLVGGWGSGRWRRRRPRCRARRFCRSRLALRRGHPDGGKLRARSGGWLSRSRGSRRLAFSSRGGRRCRRSRCGTSLSRSRRRLRQARRRRLRQCARTKRRNQERSRRKQSRTQRHNSPRLEVGKFPRRPPQQLTDANRQIRRR